jgi:16S rRNA (guanine966-N2)-methyltransferase
MRIIAGRYGGRTIRTLAGEVTRPTTDRVREAWASTVTSLLPDGFTQARVLDVFAGSGALGLEALSRGAAHATFCECDRRALEVLRENCGLIDSAHSTTTIYAADSFAPKTAGLVRQAGPYDLVILDPPYACPAGKVIKFLRGLATAGSLSAQTLITYEHRRDARGANESSDGSALCSDGSPLRLQMVSCKTYGITQIEYLFYQ